MAVSEATMREWATPVPEDQWDSLRYPTNNKSDAELIARTLRGEESDIDAITCIAQELLNRRRYRILFDGKDMSWDTVGGYTTERCSWREILYAGSQFTALTGGYHKNTANPMDVEEALDINAMEIPDEWRHACELADE